MQPVCLQANSAGTAPEIWLPTRRNHSIFKKKDLFCNIFLAIFSGEKESLV